MHYNDERRIVFNPKVRFTTKEKMNIVNRELGKLQTNVTKELINAVLESWDFESHGFITQKKVSVMAGRSIATVKRHWNDFKDDVEAVNNAFELKKSIVVKQPKPKGISIEKYIFNMRCKFTTMEPAEESFCVIYLIAARLHILVTTALMMCTNGCIIY